ncbi:unnamed protein product [Penicillium olsonii]|uniref:LCCL domain-containing protein n=1 Tax=Penicillium olsonii TaxID=99116 RepID=A0A9W4HXC0_PENOL|nr:unnamed protein product [Penicillium olsonii]
MPGEGPGEPTGPYVPPLLEDDVRLVNPEASEDLPPPDVEAGTDDTGPLPVWLQESSKSFRWGWVPLPIRKVGRATANWVKGPDPPHMLLLTPLFPRVQELPVQYLDRWLPKRKHKTALLLVLYASWFLPWFLILLHSRSSGYIEGYGRPQTLSCSTNFWYVTGNPNSPPGPLTYLRLAREFDNGCGMNGNDCRPFSSSSIPFRCPANCRDTILLEPHIVGNHSYNYQSLVIGGPQPESSELALYRADSFVCQAAIHAGTISNDGGCGVVKLEGAAHSFPSVKQHGIQSAGFSSTFPKAFSFLQLSSPQASCPSDPRWTLLGITAAAVGVLWLFCTSPPVLFFSSFFMVFCHTGLVGDPPSDPFLAELVSSLLSRLLPASFVVYVLYKFCAAPLLRPISSPIYQLSKMFLFLPPLFIGALNNYTFARLIPLKRLTPMDIQKQPGAKLALAFVIPIVLSIILTQAWQIRQGGLLPRYLKIYGTMGLIILILLPLPGLRLRIHHYILAILLMPGTAFPTRPSLVYQGLLLGLFINGVARWGFASIIETPAALGEQVPNGDGISGWWGATYPNVTSSSVKISLPESEDTYRGNGNITFALWEHERMSKLAVDGISVLLNDVERWRGYLDEDKAGEFAWHRHGHDGLELQTNPRLVTRDLDTVEESQSRLLGDDSSDAKPDDLFFRFAFLRGAEAGTYGPTGVWLSDGTCVTNAGLARSDATSARHAQTVGALASHVDLPTAKSPQSLGGEFSFPTNSKRSRALAIDIINSVAELARNTSASKPVSQFTPQFVPSPQNSTQSQASSKQSTAKPKGPVYKTNPAIEQHDSSSGFEGSSSLSAHGAYASAFLESAVSKSSPQVLSSPKINAALSSLKQIVGMQNQRREADLPGSRMPSKTTRIGTKCDIRHLEMPPLEMVLRVLRHVKEYPSSCFGGYMPFLKVEHFIENCREVYFCAEEYSDAAFIVTNFCLYSVFFELGITKTAGSLGEECQEYIDTCRNNLEAALANLNILMPATQESIMALAVGAMHALEISKPSVAWSLASTGMHLCQTLGYHRMSSMEHDSVPVQRQKQLVFWTVYTILNMMSLRLGRACPIQNYDISLPMPVAENLDVLEPWAPVCVLWTRSAIIQSKIYQYLYSPEALQQPESHRVTHAQKLAAEMKSSIMEPFEAYMASTPNLPELDIVYLTTDKVSRLSILTLIYRAIPASPASGSTATFIPECIETAREALEAHRQCGAFLNETDDFMKASYMHWAVLLSPFVPFIVIFCNVITTSNQEDLARLDEFVTSLVPLRSFSQSIDRLHTLCSVLATVARLYFEANTRPQTDAADSFIQVGQEFDTYLGALGLPNNFTGNTQMGSGYLQPDAPVHVSSEPASMLGFPAESQDPGAAQLGNWFWGNQYMMGLLEEDISQFNAGWP